MLDYLRNLLTASRRRNGERGASAVEYGLLVAGIAAVIVAVVFLLGGHIQNAFKNTDDCISTNGAAANCQPSASHT